MATPMVDQRLDAARFAVVVRDGALWPEPAVTLSDGTLMPQVGLGLYKVPAADTRRVVNDAIEVGYRSFDTAAMYENEQELGAALRDVAGLKVFVTTKLANECHGFKPAIEAAERSLAKLGVDQIDLYLIHWPLPSQDRYLETWEALEHLRASGVTRSIGVSNFTEAMLRRLQSVGATVPSVNQVELHPYLSQRSLRRFHSTCGIQTVAWSPLARGRDLLSDPAVLRISSGRGWSPAQVVLGWHLLRGNVIIPKSVHQERLLENFAATHLVLEESEAAQLDSLDRGLRLGPDPDEHG